jgi:endonuclease/exonuclease/phosphatase family metal-dependent hydrolase
MVHGCLELEIKIMKRINLKAAPGWLLQGLIIAGICLIILALPIEADAKEKRVVKVMTQNLYLGADLTPALTATTPQEFVGAVAVIYGTAPFTNFPVRAAAIADTIWAERPDIVGFQEVSTWTSFGDGDPPTLDFLQILQFQLSARALNYDVVAVSNNAEIGPVPQFFQCAPATACFVTLSDRDVILVNADNTDLVVTDTASGLYVAQLVLPTAVGPVAFDRGWAYINGTFDGKKFRFLNTHLETAAGAPFQEAQGQEFLFGPANTGGAVIAVGDFNSAADGNTTSTYNDLTTDFFKDAWDENSGDPGFTCCQSSALVNFPTDLSSRIDLILTMGAARALRTKLIGDEVFQGIPPLWASDHAGVISEVRIH